MVHRYTRRQNTHSHKTHKFKSNYRGTAENFGTKGICLCKKYYHLLKTVHWKENGLHKHFLFGTFSCLSGAVTRYLRRNNLERFMWFIQDLEIWPMMMRKTWHRDAVGSLLVEQEANREEGECAAGPWNGAIQIREISLP